MHPTYGQARSYRLRLLSELIARRNRNPAYSLRSFARDLRISPAALSQTLSAKRNLSKTNLLKVSERLAFSVDEIRQALAEVGTNAIELADSHFDTLSEDTFHFMADWYHFAILSMAKTGRAKSAPGQIAKHLGITSHDARGAIQRLCRLGLLQSKSGKLVATARPLKTTSDIPSSALRQLQHQHMRLAAESLERDLVHERDMTSVTFAADPKKLPEAKTMIKKFRRKLATFLEGHQNATEIYVLALQLFPAMQGDRK